jgi:hypothetical protein
VSEEEEKVRMEITSNIQQTAELLDGLRRSIFATYWSYSAQLQRLRVFRDGHDKDAMVLYDRAQSNPDDENLQHMAECGSRGTGYLDLLLTEFEVYALKFESFARFVDDLQLHLGSPQAELGA